MEARELLDEALVLSREMKNEAHALEIQARIAENDLRAGNANAALELATSTLERAEAMGGLAILRTVLYRVRGFAVLATGGDVAAAHECFEVSLRAAQTWNNPYERAITLDALSRTAQLLRHPEAAGLREEARALIERQGGVSVGVLSLLDVVELPTSETVLSDA